MDIRYKMSCLNGIIGRLVVSCDSAYDDEEVLESSEEKRALPITLFKV